MKKFLTTIGLVGYVFLNGCSFIGEVNDTVEYADITTEYIKFNKNFCK